MNKRKGISPNVLVLITLITTGIFLYAYASGTKGPEVSHLKSYDDIEKLVSSVTFDIVVPEYIYEYSKDNEVNAESVMGQIIQINCQDFAFKASYFVDNNADILGLYGKSEVDKKYNVSSNDKGIKYFRYRTGYKDFPHTTLINWNTDETTHGIMLANIVSEDEALELLSISRDKLADASSIDNSNTQTEVEESILTETYTVGDNIQISLPKFSNNVSMVDNGVYASFYVDNSLLFIFEYTGKDSGIEASNSVYTNENMCIKYMNDTDENNNDYNLFKSNIIEIKDSIIVLD